MSEVAKKDSRLRGRLIPVGSYFCGLKILLPDEFDFLYELETLTENRHFEVKPSGFRGENNMWRTPKGNPSRRKIYLKTPNLFKTDKDDHGTSWIHSINGSSVLDPVGVKNTLFSAISDAVENFDTAKLPTYLSFDKTERTSFMYGPATTLFLRWNGRFYKNLRISVDVTVCVKASSWQDQFDFLRDGFMSETSSLSSVLEKEMIDHGYHLVPYISSRGHVQWQLSTSNVETKLFARYHDNSSLKQVIRLVKATKLKYLKHQPNLDSMKDKMTSNFLKFVYFYEGKDYDDEMKHLISSFLIKNIVLHLCGFATKREWNSSSLSTLYILTLSMLYRGFPENSIRNYFISKHKLNMPEYGDILPGFYEIFKNINIEEIHEDVDILDLNCPEELDELWDSNPFNKAIVKTIFKVTKDHIETNFHNCWNTD